MPVIVKKTVCLHDVGLVLLLWSQGLLQSKCWPRLVSGVPDLQC